MQFDRKLQISQGDVLHPPSFTPEDGGPVDIYVPKNVALFPRKKKKLNVNNRLRENLKSHTITVWHTVHITLFFGRFPGFARLFFW